MHSIAHLVIASLTLSASSHADDSPLTKYLELTDAQLQQIKLALRPEVQPSAQGGVARVYQYTDRPGYPRQPASSVILLLTETQRSKLPALQEAIERQLNRLGAISMRLIDAPQETSGCWCIVEDAFARYLNLTNAQRAELRGRAPVERLSVLTPEQRAKFEVLQTRPSLLDAADQAARMGLIADPIPRYECLCN